MEERTIITDLKIITEEVLKTKIKLSLAALGPIGSALDEVLFGTADRIKARRLENFVNVIAKKQVKFEEASLSKDFINSEEFYDLSSKVIKAVLNSRHYEKHQILANIYMYGIYGEKIQTELKEIFISMIDEFTTNHLIVFKFLIEHREQFDKCNSFEELYKNFSQYHFKLNIDKYEFRLYCRDLENKSLLRFSKNINEYGSTGGYLALEDYSEVPGITITTLGMKFIEFLKD